MACHSRPISLTFQVLGKKRQHLIGYNVWLKIQSFPLRHTFYQENIYILNKIIVRFITSICFVLCAHPYTPSTHPYTPHSSWHHSQHSYSLVQETRHRVSQVSTPLHYIGPELAIFTRLDSLGRNGHFQVINSLNCLVSQNKHDCVIKPFQSTSSYLSILSHKDVKCCPYLV